MSASTFSWENIQLGDNVAALTSAYGIMGPGTEDSRGVVAIKPATDGSRYAIEMDGGAHFFPEQDRVALVIRSGITLFDIRSKLAKRGKSERP